MPEHGDTEIVGAITYAHITRSCGHTEPIGGLVDSTTRQAWIKSVIEEYSLRPCIPCGGKQAEEKNGTAQPNS